MREAENELDEEDPERFDNMQSEMLNDMHNQQINVKKFDLQPPAQVTNKPAAIAQKRPNGTTTGIGGGLKRPTLLKAPSKNVVAAATAATNGVMARVG